jgi:hypothetical protein
MTELREFANTIEFGTLAVAAISSLLVAAFNLVLESYFRRQLRLGIHRKLEVKTPDGRTISIADSDLTRETVSRIVDKKSTAGSSAVAW